MSSIDSISWDWTSWNINMAIDFPVRVVCSRFLDGSVKRPRAGARRPTGAPRRELRPSPTTATTSTPQQQDDWRNGVGMVERWWSRPTTTTIIIFQNKIIFFSLPVSARLANEHSPTGEEKLVNFHRRGIIKTWAPRGRSLPDPTGNVQTRYGLRNEHTTPPPPPPPSPPHPRVNKPINQKQVFFRRWITNTLTNGQ